MTKTFSLGKLHFKFNLLIALCLIMAISGFVRLGLWQLDRANEKLQLQSRFELKQQDGPASIESLSLAGLEADALQLQNTPVLLAGQYLNSQSLYLIYQPFMNQVGYEIITPFKLASSEQIVLVSRGWIAAAPKDALIKKLPPIVGNLQLTGQIYVPTKAMASKQNTVQNNEWPLVLRFLNTLELAPLFKQPLFPYVVRLDEDQTGVLVRHWPTVVADTGRNQTYALQWFAMAIAIAIVSLILSSNFLALLAEKSKPL